MRVEGLRSFHTCALSTPAPLILKRVQLSAFKSKKFYYDKQKFRKQTSRPPFVIKM